MIIWFCEEAGPEVIGTKAFNLCRLARAGFAVPPGFCISADTLPSVGIREIEEAFAKLHVPAVAVRSSALEEDLPLASFAGIYPTRLNVSTPDGVRDALREIHAAASAPATIAYCRKRGLPECIRMAAIVQELVVPDASGVLFMKDPVGGSAHVVVEGSWGLGEAVVTGAVTPDRWVLSRDGEIMTTIISDKDIAIMPDKDGTRQIEIEPARRRLSCLDEASLRQLFELARCCEEFFGTPQDIEWAAAADRIWLLQSRPITK